MSSNVSFRELGSRFIGFSGAVSSLVSQCIELEMAGAISCHQGGSQELRAQRTFENLVSLFKVMRVDEVKHSEKMSKK